MKSISLLLIVTLGVSVSTFAQSEDAAIQKTVMDFLEGGTNGEVDRFKNAFVADAVQKSVSSNTGAVNGMTVAQLVSKVKPGAKMDRSTKIVSYSYANDAATAITETLYSTSKIVDLLNLLKINGEWKIVSRVFSRMEPNEEVSSGAGKALSVSATKAAKPAPKKKPVVSDDGW